MKPILTGMTVGAFALASGAMATGNDAARIVLLAHAVDARAAVFAAASGEKVRVKEGDTLPGTDLKLQVVDALGVELRAPWTVRGQPLSVRLRDGQSMAPQKLDALRAQIQSQAPHPAAIHPVRTPPTGVKR